MAVRKVPGTLDSRPGSIGSESRWIQGSSRRGREGRDWVDSVLAAQIQGKCSQGRCRVEFIRPITLPRPNKFGPTASRDSSSTLLKPSGLDQGGALARPHFELDRSGY